MSTTGERIRNLRLQNHLTLDDVARHLGVGRQAIYKYEQGTVTNIPLDNLERMAQLFNTTPGYLAGWTASPPEHVRLSEKEHQLVTTYRALPDPGREYLLQQARIAQITFGEKSSSVSDNNAV